MLQRIAAHHKRHPNDGLDDLAGAELGTMAKNDNRFTAYDLTTEYMAACLYADEITPQTVEKVRAWSTSLNAAETERPPLPDGFVTVYLPTIVFSAYSTHVDIDTVCEFLATEDGVVHVLSFYPDGTPRTMRLHEDEIDDAYPSIGSAI